MLMFVDILYAYKECSSEPETTESLEGNLVLKGRLLKNGLAWNRTGLEIHSP